jgi:hypothetical protein
METESAELRNALNSINFDASSYRVLDFYIIFTFILGLSVVGGSLIVFTSSDLDPSLTEGVSRGLIIGDIIFVVFILVAYFFYLRNIGYYIYGRIKPLDVKNSKS